MTQTKSHRSAAGPRTGWLGWVIFAGIMMIMVGLFQAVVGLVAMFDDNFYLVTERGLLVPVDYTVWGLVHLVIGLIILAAGWAVLNGRIWGRTIGIILAGIGALVNMAFISAYPFWSIILIALDVLVIYSLAVHGREARS